MCVILDFIYFQQMEIVVDNNDEVEDVLKKSTTTAGNASEEELVTKLSDSNDNWQEKGEEISLNDINDSDGDNLDNETVIFGGDHHRNDQQCEKIDQNVKNATNMTAGMNHYTKSTLVSPKSFPTTSPSFPSPSSSWLSSLSSKSQAACMSTRKPDHSDSDSGVSDLSLDSTFYKSAKKYTPTSILNYSPKEKEVSKSNIDTACKKSKMTRKQSEHTQSQKLHLQIQDSLVDGLLYGAKLFLMFLILTFLIIVTFIASHVRCFNSICAISLESRISYHKYASPI